MRIILIVVSTAILGLTACVPPQPQQNTGTNSSLNLKSSPTPSQARQVELPADVSEIVTSITRLIQAGQNMQSARTGNLKECGELMRKYRKEIEALEPKSEALPKLYSTYLHPAVIELKTCTSCSPNAFEACIRANTNLADLTNRLLER